jgi:hypothetical protein
VTSGQVNPGQVSQPIDAPQREPGSAPARGTGAVAAAPGRVAAVASVGAPPVPPVGEDGRTPAPAAVRSATVDRHWADAVDRDDRPDEDDDAPGGLRGARSELRAKLRSQRRLRVISLVSLSILVLGLLPLFFGVRAASRDPVFNSLDALDVPGWAAQQVDDKSDGSRWCFLDCRFRERNAQSERPFEETNGVYSAALKNAGWQPWQVGSCPEQPITDGKYTCWRRDEFTLDLWVRLPECAVDAVAAQDPATVPSAGPDGVVNTEKPADCVGSTVSIKVQNAITDQRGKPEQAPDPGLIGETPDPVPSNDLLTDPTPSPS